MSRRQPRWNAPRRRDSASERTGTPAASNDPRIESAGSGDRVTTIGSKNWRSRFITRFSSCAVGPVRRNIRAEIYDPHRRFGHCAVLYWVAIREAT